MRNPIGIALLTLSFSFALAQSSSCNWPQDTTIYVSDLVVELDREELEAIGFQITGDESKGGIFYSNAYQGDQASWFNWYEGNRGRTGGLEGRLLNEKNRFTGTPTSNNFYPVYMSGMDGGPQFFVPQSSIDGYENQYEQIKDELIPVQPKNIKLTFPGTLFYFKASPEFFKKLPKRYAHLEETLNCAQKSGNEIIQSHWDLLTQKGTSGELDESILQKIGFQMTDSALYYRQFGVNGSFDLNMKFTKRSWGSAGPLDSLSEAGLTPGINLLYTTNSKGMLREFVMHNEKFNMEKFDETYDSVVPVLFRQERYPDRLREDLIFWFEPTKVVQALLEQE